MKTKKIFKLRRTGETTAIALGAIQCAISHPGEYIKVEDHCPIRWANVNLFKIIADTVEALNLDFSFDRHRLCIKSNNFGLIIDENGEVQELTEELYQKLSQDKNVIIRRESY